ncbi:hypothetical protein JXQ31_15865 [candidate division KSB1 bacterium]|nr:hypothetical protein [candidate division KSB1 bacterium]
MCNRSLKYLCFVILFRSALLCAALDDMPNGAIPLGMGGAYCGSAQTPENLFYNPACVWLNSGIKTIVFTDRLYGLKELRHNGFSSGIHFRNTTFAIGVQTFGNVIYQENVFCTGLSRKFNAVYLGAVIRYGMISIKGYGQDGTMITDLGGLVEFTDTINWGWAVRNALYAEIGRCNEKLPQTIITGFKILPVRQMNLNIDLYKETRFPIDYRCGVEGSFLKYLVFRTGIGTAPSRFSAGFSLIIHNICIDYAFNTHPYLEVSHFFSIGFLINQK